MTPRPLRVLMVVQRLLPYLAGAEIQSLGLASALARVGAEVSFLSTLYVRGLPRVTTARGMSVRRLRVLRGPLLKPSQMLSTAASVAVHAGEFDVVHAHCVSAASLGAAVGARLGRIPVLMKPSLGGEDGELAKVVRSPASGPLLGVLRRVDRFASLNADITDELVEVGVRRERVEHVDNGVDLETFRPASPDERRALRERLGLPAEAPIVLFAGQLVARKAIVETLEAWPEVASAVDGALLLVAGDGDQVEAVRRASADPASRVRYLGVLDGVADVMRASDVFVLPSRNESFGNAIVEAMACGLPVVVGRAGVAATLEIDGMAGRVLDAPGPAEIARALRDTLAEPDRGAALGVRGRSLAEPFGYERVAGHYMEIYESMVEGRRR